MQKVFFVKVKKSEASRPNSLPFHPEYSYVGSLDENVWEAKNMATGELVKITKQDGEVFVEYEVEQI